MNLARKATKSNCKEIKVGCNETKSNRNEIKVGCKEIKPNRYEIKLMGNAIKLGRITIKSAKVSEQHNQTSSQRNHLILYFMSKKNEM